MKGLALQHINLYRKRISSVVRNLAVLKDITGSAYRSSATHPSNDLDECIIDIISNNNFAGQALKNITSKQRCPFVDILAILEKIRYSESFSNWDDQFLRLELLLSNGTWCVVQKMFLTIRQNQQQLNTSFIR